MSHKSWEFQVGVEFKSGLLRLTVKGIGKNGVFTNDQQYYSFEYLEEHATITHQPHKNLVEPVFEPCVQREVFDMIGGKVILLGKTNDTPHFLVLRANGSVSFSSEISELPETTKLSDSFPDQDVTPDQVERIKKILEEK